jgi:hypothetical protein
MAKMTMANNVLEKIVFSFLRKQRLYLWSLGSGLAPDLASLTLWKAFDTEFGWLSPLLEFALQPALVLLHYLYGQSCKVSIFPGCAFWRVRE